MNQSSVSLSYCEYGCKNGFPVLLHHGLVGSDYLPPHWHNLAKTVGIKLIAVARPGYARSPVQNMSAIIDWGDIIAPLLDDLGVTNQFATIGISAGAPYAYALANHFAEQCHGVWVLSGMPFVADPHIFALYPAAARAIYQQFAELTDDELAMQMRGYLENTLSEATADAELTHLIDDTLCHDGQGIVREIRLQTAPWGFSPYDITCPIELWHSREDDEVPFAAVQAMVGQMRNAILHIQKSASHFPDNHSEQELFNSMSIRCHSRGNQ
ncbi:alpha/beta hydrolase [Suttonella sp. R2A3]|uniref:alpha/beta fold hydrolase n=1 Tax=Suttonella sp. R2A3 TaxID=2908648 RepID=UPI001F27BEE5|nr:alpha/beta hydrolase [Suttonella sp. R2A3]UJF25128.1 alpha/beta hydrolase [Suttonella sp. R2A3]